MISSDLMFFDGVDDYVDLGAIQTLGDGDAWEVTITPMNRSN